MKQPYSTQVRALLYRSINLTEKINLGYSIKNIPIPIEKMHLLQLMEKSKHSSKISEGKLYSMIRTARKTNGTD